MKISASILSIKEDLKEKIELLDKTSIDYFHLDIMDGIFVENKTWNIEEILYLFENTTKPLDVHLMVSDVFKYVEDFKILKPSYLTFHYETNIDIIEMIIKIKSYGIKAGLSINPDTDVKLIEEYLPFLDLVLIMSVYPGYGGQEFIDSVINKINYLKEKQTNYVIQVDGGITDKTINLVKDVDIVVVGNYITSGDYEERINNIRS